MPVSTDPFGELESAQIKLSGVLIPIDVERGTEYVGRIYCTCSYAGIEHFLTISPDVPLVDRQGLIDPKAQYFLLPLDKDSSLSITGLLLRFLRDGVFERVGHWHRYDVSEEPRPEN